MFSVPSKDRVRDQGPVLVVVPSVAIAKDGNRYVIDEKAASGLDLYSKFWPGPVRCIFREGNRSSLLFGRSYDAAQLPFQLLTLPANATVPDEYIADASVVMASGDNWLDFPIADQGSRLGVAVCFVIEYILQTRLQILALSNGSLASKTKSFLWNVLMEKNRREAFSISSGLQFNGTPAAAAYASIGTKGLTFFDTRLSYSEMATDQEITVKQARIMSGAPLRLAFTGRLERMKGADDLIKIAMALDRGGTKFSLAIYGAGSLASEMRTTLNNPAASGTLSKKVFIHEPVDFNSELVPKIRTEVDLFLCCHRQSDPSCTYLETLGCGVPLLGYDNRALAGILNLADVGWMSPMNAKAEIIRKIVDIDANRLQLAKKMKNAQNFAKSHSFESEFKSRVDHLWQLAAHTRHRVGAV